MASYARRAYLSDGAKEQNGSRNKFIAMYKLATGPQPKVLFKKNSTSQKTPWPILDLALTYPWV